MAVSVPTGPRDRVIELLRESESPLTLRELAASALLLRRTTPWRDLRRAVWAMMEDGTLVFTPDWEIALSPSKRSRSGGVHGRTKSRRPTARRAG